MAGGLVKLKFTDVNETINVSFTVEDNDNFQVYQAEGLDDAEKTLGLNFKELPFHINSFVDFAQRNDLKLVKITPSGETTLQDFSGVYYNAGLGIDNL